MKTAMQEAIEWINETKNHSVFDVQDKLIELLEKEKQQIIDAFECGNDLGHKGRLPSGEGYYNNIFKTV